MKRNDVRRSLLSLLLALAMLLPVMPAARAATSYVCELCKKACSYTVLKEANCQEQGVDEYICTNVECALVSKEILVKTPVNPGNHDTICTDNGDGATHTATCRICASYRNVSELHNFVNGYCSECTAADYAQAEIVIASSLDLYVGLNDTQASLSIGNVAVKVGNVDVTENYTLSYSWMDQTGAIVGDSQTYYLPSGITSKVGDYTYGCFVMAMPKGLASGKYVSKSCTINVHVRDLVVASATVNADDPDFALNDINSRTPVSVAQQIYQAAYNLTSAYPSYVVFGAEPDSGVGTLKAPGGRYYFSPSATTQGLDKVIFDPSGTLAGSYVINFTVYDTEGRDFPGVLTIIVERDIGTVDVSYLAAKGEPVTLDADDFEAFWQKTYQEGSVTLLYFKELPDTKEGVLYYNYSTHSHTGTRVTTADMYYSVFSSASQKLIDGVTFVPDSRFTGYVTIPFEVYGLTNQGRYALLDGNLSIFVSTGTVQDVTYSVTSGSAVSLSGEDFLPVYQLATGTKAANFSIKLLDVPENGSLYIDYTGTARDKALTAATVSDYTFHYSSAISNEIRDLTYLTAKSSTAKTDTLRYVACDSKGEFVYVGEIVLSSKPSVVVYTKHFTDVPKTSSTEWYYTAVMDLAEAGVISGMTETTYEPETEVTYAQALKLIMLATGYAEPAKTGKHWASGYLTLAQADGLVSTTITESYLDRKIARNVIAQIAAKAMKLPDSQLTVSPFSDVIAGSTYAPYIFALYEAGIVQGDDSSGTARFYGVNSIRRSEMAVIVWRINNYSQTT